MADDCLFSIYNLEECECAVRKCIDDDKLIQDYYCTVDKIKSGNRVLATVVSKDSGGLVCKINDNDSVKCFLSTRDPKYQLGEDVYDSVSEGSMIECQIMEYDYYHSSFQLKYIACE